MYNWKAEIRKVMMLVRTQFIQWVDHFTQTFVNSLKDIELAEDLREFIGEDRRMRSTIEGLRDKYISIMKVFTVISNSPVEKKLEVIEKHRKQI